jgi:hypothetical protein
MDLDLDAIDRLKRPECERESLRGGERPSGRVFGQALDPLAEIGSAADHFASKAEHLN